MTGAFSLLHNVVCLEHTNEYEQVSQPAVYAPETDWVILKVISDSMVSSHGEVESPLLQSGLAFVTLRMY